MLLCSNNHSKVQEGCCRQIIKLFGKRDEKEKAKTKDGKSESKALLLEDEDVKASFV